MGNLERYLLVSRIVMAIQYTGNNEKEVKGANDRIIPSPVLEPTEDNNSGRYLQICPTNSSLVKDIIIAMPGDWIVFNEDTSISVISNDKFIIEYTRI